MTLDELTRGVRWHYENGYNMLEHFIEERTPIPQELIEEAREKAYAAGLPFSERPYRGQEIDPYVYDGSMTPEDYELMLQIIEQERSKNMSNILSVCISNREKYENGISGGEWLNLPATIEQLQAAIKAVNATPDNFFVYDFDSSIPAVTRLTLDEIRLTSLDKLNFLAARLEPLDPTQIEKLNAVNEVMGYWNDAHHLVEYTHNTDYFVHIPNVFNSIQLGEHYLENTEMIQIPEEWIGAINIEMLGQLAAEHEKGQFTEHGYILESGDEWQHITEVPEQYRIMSFPQPEHIREDTQPIDYDIATAPPLTEQPPAQPQPVIPIVLTSENPADKLKEITDRLESGIQDIFNSEQYANYLNTLSKFHNYSLNNTILIAMQKPDATHVAGFNTWKNEFERNVIKGQKGIKIIAPSPYKVKVQQEKTDPDTGKPVIGADGKPITEETERKIPAYKVVSVFDVSQTEGKELPTIGVDTLTGSVEQYNNFFVALEKTSLVPIAFENIEGGANGYYHLEDKRIAINEGMSELQTLKTAIHEIAHSRLHDIDLNAPAEEQDEHPRPNRKTREVQAESIAYTVCQHYGLDTSDYSFGYVAGWSSGKELTELKASLETIRTAAAELIKDIDEHFAELQQSQDMEQQTPVFTNLPPEQQQALSDEVKATLQFFVDSDIKERGELSDGTLEAIAVQGYEYRDGQLEKFPVIEEMPDPTITVEQMQKYGYVWKGMLPLQEEKALHFYEKEKVSIYRLYQDDSEGMVESLDDLHSHAEWGGIFGIEKDTLEHLKNRQDKEEQIATPQPGIEQWSEPATDENAPGNPGEPSDDIDAYLPQQEQLTATAEPESPAIPYYPINETAARRAKEANSYSDYKPGSATAEYKQMVDEAATIAERQKKHVDPMYHEKIDSLLNTYARKLAENMNNGFSIDARVPSILITGGGNFPVRKKEKQNAARDKNMEEWRDIRGLLDKIRSTGMGGISADDPNAVSKLESKLAGLEKSQENMKAANAYYRKHKTLDGCPVLSSELIQKLTSEMANRWYGRAASQPFEAYSLQNNNAEINRLKKRIESLKVHEVVNHAGWDFDGGRVEANKQDNRLQVFFDDKPDVATRDDLKRNGFRWSPKATPEAGAWQRQLNYNAYYAANDVKSIHPLTGERPTDLYRQAKREATQPAPMEQQQAEPEKPGDTFSIYKLKQDDSTRDIRFEPLDRLQAAGVAIEPGNYELVYTALISEDTANLDRIF